MKKYTVALTLCGILPFMGGAFAYEDYTQSQPVVKTSVYKSASTNRQAKGYKNTIVNNFYYTDSGTRNNYYDNYNLQPAKSAQPVAVYDIVEDDYAPMPQRINNKPRKQNVRETKSNYSKERKFFLAHPFFQPLKGNVGSVTELSFTQNNFKLDMLNGTVFSFEPSHEPVSGGLTEIIEGKQQTSQFLIKEDISIGVTDDVSLMLMAQYDKTKTAFKDWSDGSSDDSESNSGLNIFGIGLQNRIVDNDKVIGMVSGYFQHQRDAANTFIGEIKAGYKVSRSTIYGIVRARYSNLIEGDTYGSLVRDDTGDWLLLSYKQNVKDVIDVEGGLGVFSVLGKYITFNGDLLFGHYDWHEQLNLKGAIGWQPANMFALNLYASTSLYDTAKGKTKTYMYYDVPPITYPVDKNDNPLYTDSKILYKTGDYKIKNYNEWSIGVQAILYF